MLLRNCFDFLIKTARNQKAVIPDFLPDYAFQAGIRDSLENSRN